MPKSWFALLALLACQLAWAQAGASPSSSPLRVIEASDSSVPLDAYFSYLIAGEEQDEVLQGLRFPMISKLRPALLAPELEGKQVFDSKWLTQPVFVVGSDPLSLDWLESNLASLDRLGASGVVVSASNPQAFKRLQLLADGLPVAPALGNWLQERLFDAGIETIPVLVQLDGRVASNLGAQP